jgi:cation transport ATPase
MSGPCKFKPYQPQQQNDNKVEEPDKKILETLLLASMAVVIVLIAWMNLLQPTSLGNIGVVPGWSYPIFKQSLVALRKGRVNMELSMVIAIIASLALYQYLPVIMDSVNRR